jgi:hypothetical protein
MIDERCNENSGDYGNRFLESSRKNECEQLSLVTDLGKGDYPCGYDKGLHRLVGRCLATSQSTMTELHARLLLSFDLFNADPGV